MRLGEVVRYEVARQARQPATWAYLAVLLGLSAALSANADPAVATRRAPANLASLTVMIGLLATLVSAALFVDAGHRDVRFRMDRLFYTAPLRERDYLGGRFLGVLLVNALLLLAVPAGMIAGTRLLAADGAAAGPVRLDAYLLPYAILLLPNLLVTAALLYGATTLTRRSLPGYLASVGLLAANLFSLNEATGFDVPRLWALVDPTGSVALAAATKGWTLVERETRLVEPTALMLWNRALWATLGLAMLALTHARFRFAHPEQGGRLPGEDDAAPAGGAASRPEPALARSARRSFGARTRVRQTIAVARGACRHILLARELALVAIGLLAYAFFMATESQSDPMFGARLWPMTHRIVSMMTGRFMDLPIAMLVAFYAGELVWRERDARAHELGDTQPMPDWVPFVGKLLALAALLVVLQSIQVAAGIAAQLSLGFRAVEPGLYVRTLLGLQLGDSLLVAALALVLHVLVNQKYAGHMVVALAIVFPLAAGRLGIEHNLLVYGADPGWIYSDLAGFGSAVPGWIAFKLYWASWALLLSWVALLFWTRGTERGATARLGLARRRLTRRALAIGAGAAALVLGTGGFVLYNTTVLNPYVTGWARDEVEAEYERRFKRFDGAPQPWLVGVRLHVEIHPARRAVAARGTYRLVNRTTHPVDSVHLSTNPHWPVVLRDVRFDRPSTLALDDGAHGFRIYALGRPLAPGDSLVMTFETSLAARGFRNRETLSANAALLGRFTHVDNRLLLPSIGYQREYLENAAPAVRRAHGLPPRDRRRSIDDSAARRIPRGTPESDWIAFEATVGTDAGQTPVLPGTLQRTWTADGRRYFHYRADAPIPNWYSALSGAYAEHRARWSGVDVRVLHHPAHAFNVERMVREAGASLDYYSTRFGPYPFRQLTLVEFPRYGSFGRAYPGQMLFTEGHPIAVARSDEPGADADVPLLVTAHEIAHQWWGQMVKGADVEGGPALSETLAQYSALMVLERTRGADAARRFARAMHYAYLDGRGTHDTPEVPLMLTTDHEYIHYRKGAVVMYSLKEYVGEDSVNAALGRLAERHALKGPPYATTRDLYAELERVTPDSLRPLLHDLVADVMLWDLEAVAARAEPAGAGEWRVTIDVEAGKMRADGVGNDTPVPMSDPVEIGVYGKPEGGRGPAKPLYLAAHRVRSGRQSITVTVRGEPATAAIDPRHLLIARRRAALAAGKSVAVTLPGTRPAVATERAP